MWIKYQKGVDVCVRMGRMRAPRRRWGCSKGRFQLGFLVKVFATWQCCKKVSKRCWRFEWDAYNSRPWQGRRKSLSELIFYNLFQTIFVDVFVDFRFPPLDDNQSWQLCWWRASQQNFVFYLWALYWSCTNRCDLNKKASLRLNWRVWSWLRLNAGGMLNTCKSNVKAFGWAEWRTGE